MSWLDWVRPEPPVRVVWLGSDGKECAPPEPFDLPPMDVRALLEFTRDEQ